MQSERKAKQPGRLERHPASGIRGLPKKGGFKGWGKLGEEGYNAEAVVDEKDPNYFHAEEQEEQSELSANKPTED